MNAERRWSFWFLCLLPLLSIALAGARPLSELPGHAFIGIGLSIVALDCARRLVRPTAEPHSTTARLPVLAGALLIGPWMIAKGILKILAAVNLKMIRGRIFIFLAGFLSVVFGLLIIFYPFAKANGITVFLGLFALIIGTLYIVDSIRYRKLSDTLDLLL